MMSAATYDSIDSEMLSFSKQLTNKNGGKYVVVSHAGKRLHFQYGVDETDMMISPFGISTEYSKEDGSKLSLDLNLSDAKKQCTQGVEEKMIQEAILQGADWFKNKANEAAIRGMHTSVIKVSSKPEYADRVRVKIVVHGNDQTAIFVGQVENGVLSYRSGSVDDLVKNCMVLPIVNGSIWFMNRMWGMSLTASALIVVPPLEVKHKSIDAFVLSCKAVEMEVDSDPN